MGQDAAGGLGISGGGEPDQHGAGGGADLGLAGQGCGGQRGMPGHRGGKIGQVNQQISGADAVDGDRGWGGPSGGLSGGGGHRKLLISMPSARRASTMLRVRATESGESPWTHTESASTFTTEPSMAVIEPVSAT